MAVDTSSLLRQQQETNTKTGMAANIRAEAERQRALIMEEIAKRKQEMASTASPVTHDRGYNAEMVSQQPYNPAPGEAGEYMSPYSGSYAVTQRYGNVNPQLYAGITPGARHLGVDIATPMGTQVRSILAGRARSGTDKNWGNYVLLEAQDGNTYRFSHLSRSSDLFRQAQNGWVDVGAGAPLGFTGSTGNSTGPHLDLSVTRGGRYIDPMSIEALRRSIYGQ